MDKPFSQACANNQGPICAELARHFAGVGEVLEIGSGTGQHAVFCARHLAALNWQPTDLAENLPGIEAWRADAQLANVRAPLAFDVRDSWEDLARRCPHGFDAAFTANTLHIMAWSLAEPLFSGLGAILPSGAPLCVYGPFSYGGAHTSPSNERFDAWLRDRSPQQGVRDFQAVCGTAETHGFALREDRAMPANNRLLCFARQ